VLCPIKRPALEWIVHESPYAGPKEKTEEEVHEYLRIVITYQVLDYSLRNNLKKK